jgi:hypothetical protein
LETGKTMHMTYDESMKKMDERKAKKAAAKEAAAAESSKP